MISKRVVPEVIGVIINDEYVCNTIGPNGSTTVKHYANDEFIKFLPNIHVTLQDKNNSNHNNLINHNSKIRTLNTHLETTLIFNYTDIPLYAKGKNNIPSKIDMMKDCIDFDKYGINNRSIDIVCIQTIANPFNIVNMANSGEGDNYIDVLIKLADMKNSQDINDKEAKAIYEYLYANMPKLSNIVKGVGSNINRLHNEYIKVLIGYRIYMYDLDNSNDLTVYIENKDIMISKKNFIDMPDHPFFNNKSVLLTKHEVVHKGAAIAYLIDKHNRLAPKFYRLLDKIIRLPVLNLKDKPDGFYHEYYLDDKLQHIVIPIEDVDRIPYIYSSIEEAETGCDIDVIRKNELAIKEYEITLMNKDMALAKTRHELDKLQQEHMVIMAKKEAEHAKALLDIRKSNVEKEVLDYKAPVEKEIHAAKANADINKFNLDAAINELKMRENKMDKEVQTLKIATVATPLLLAAGYKAFKMYQQYSR